MCLLANDVLGVVGDVLAVLDVLDWVLWTYVVEGRLSCGGRAPCLDGTADVNVRLGRPCSVI